MPPVLHVAFAELAGRAEQQVFAQQARLGMDERHRVLQLIAEAESAARLVVAAARPQTARQGLVQQPAVGEHVERRVGRFHLHRAERALPVLPHLFERSARGADAAEALRPGCRASSASAPDAEHEDDFALLAVGAARTEPGSRRMGSSAAPDLAGQPRRAHRGRISQRAVAAEEFRAVAGDGARRLVHVEERHASGELACCRGCARRARRCRGPISVTTCMADFGAQIAQHPFHVAGRGESARSARLVAHLQHRELDRRIQRHVHPQLGADAVFRVLEHAVAEAVPADVRRRRRGSAAAWATRSGRSLRRGGTKLLRSHRSPDRCATA